MAHAEQQNLLPDRLGASLCAPVLLTFLLGFVFAGSASAQPYTPEILREHGVPVSTAKSRPATQLANSFAAPMPDMDARAPYAPPRDLGVAPVFSRPAGTYRGETFSGESSFDAAARDQRFPISGLALRVPLN
jgi:hypothetical protein